MSEWIDFKKLKPTKEGFYRVEFSYLLGEYKECWLWKNNQWNSQFGKPFDITLVGYLRYKPWSEE